MKYWDNICELQKKQTEKGIKTYGQTLEDNTGLSMEERLTMLEEELIDGLMYIEHIKDALPEPKETDWSKISVDTPILVREATTQPDDTTMMDVFSEDCACTVIERYTPQEIVDRIEKYEAEKKGNKDNSDEFKVGDWVKHKISKRIWKIISITDFKTVECVDKRNSFYEFPVGILEHAEPPREEKKTFNCIYYNGKGGCNGTKEIDPCKYPNCDEVKPKEVKSINIRVCNKCGCKLFPEEIMCHDCGMPVKEKQKIEKLDDISFAKINSNYARLSEKINELVDAVNELRGV